MAVPKRKRKKRAEHSILRTKSMQMRCPLFDTCCLISTKRGAGTSGRRFGQTSFRIVENVETQRDPNKGFRGTLATRITGFRRAIFFLLFLSLSLHLASLFIILALGKKRKRIRESYYYKYRCFILLLFRFLNFSW